MLVKDFGLEHGNSVQTPATHGAAKEEQEPLDQVQYSRYRSQVARCLFLSHDLADITFSVNEFMSKDVKSHSTEPCQVEQACQVFET